MHQMIVPVLRMPYPRKTHGLIRILSVSVHHVGIRNHPAFCESFPDILRLNECQKFIQILCRYILLCIGGDCRKIGKLFPYLEARAAQVAVGLIADAPVPVKLQIVHAPVVGRKCGDHFRLLFALPLLRQKLFPQLNSLLMDVRQQEDIGKHDSHEKAPGLEGIDDIHGNPLGIDEYAQRRDNGKSEGFAQGTSVSSLSVRKQNRNSDDRNKIIHEVQPGK